MVSNELYQIATENDINIPQDSLIKYVPNSIKLNPQNVFSHSYKLYIEGNIIKEKGKIERDSDFNSLWLTFYF